MVCLLTHFRHPWKSNLRKKCGCNQFIQSYSTVHCNLAHNDLGGWPTFLGGFEFIFFLPKLVWQFYACFSKLIGIIAGQIKSNLSTRFWKKYSQTFKQIFFINPFKKYSKKFQLNPCIENIFNKFDGAKITSYLGTCWKSQSSIPFWNRSWNISHTFNSKRYFLNVNCHRY